MDGKDLIRMVGPMNETLFIHHCQRCVSTAYRQRWETRTAIVSSNNPQSYSEK